MSEFSQGQKIVSRLSDLPQIPKYQVTRRADLSLAFDPPMGSRELANALSIRYPNYESLEQQVQAALLDFIRTEQNDTQNTFSQPTRQQKAPSANESITSSPKNPTSTTNNDFEASTLVWSITTGQPVEAKRKRVRYDAKKRHKVAGVRKLGACAYHRKKKIECICTITSPPSTPVSQRRQSTQSIASLVAGMSVESSPQHLTLGKPPAAPNTTSSVSTTLDISTPQPFYPDFDFNEDFYVWDTFNIPHTSSLPIFPHLPNTSVPSSSISTPHHSRLSISPVDFWKPDTDSERQNEARQ